MNTTTLEFLRARGWTGASNSLDPELLDDLVTDGFQRFAAAEYALQRFGGLSIQQRGPGLNMPREDFVIDPRLAVGEIDRFSAHADVIGRPLYPLGECGGGHYFLAIADDGRVFALMDGIVLIGGTIDEAIENLILGKRGMAPG